jgi:hypothetical protein
MPDPAVWQCASPVYDAGQDRRATEASEFLAAEYEALGWEIAVTNQTYLCDLIDCIDLDSMPGPRDEPPPPPDIVLPAGVQLQLTELDVYAELQCPENTVAMHRPTFSAYIAEDTGAASVQDWLDNFQEAVGAPGGPNRLYAGYITVAANKGTQIYVNRFAGEIEDGTISLQEMAVGCQQGGDMKQLVGIAASRDRYHKNDRGWNGDSALKLQVEFFTDGEAKTGPGKGGWSGFNSRSDFQYNGWRPYGPGAQFDPSTTSTVGGPQYESLFHIYLEEGATPEEGKWWIGHNGHWLGYYKTKLFGTGAANLLASGACQASWYTEVYDHTPDFWTWTDAASGEFADQGLGRAGHFRNPILLDPAGSWYLANAMPNAVTAPIPPPQYNPACYTQSQLFTGPPPADLMYFASGPGADPSAPGCQ